MRTALFHADADAGAICDADAGADADAYAAAFADPDANAEADAMPMASLQPKTATRHDCTSVCLTTTSPRCLE
jgi:hypothetical protein